MLKQTAIACLPLGMGSWLGLILMTTVVHLITQFKQSSFLYVNIRTPIQIQDHPSKASKFTSTPGTLRVLNEAHRCGPLCNTQQGPLMSESVPHTNYILTKWVFEGEAGNGYYKQQLSKSKAGFAWNLQRLYISRCPCRQCIHFLGNLE